MNDQEILRAFEEITVRADACCVERKVREHQMKQDHTTVRRPIRAAAVLAAVLAMVMIPAAAFGIVYGYRAFQTDNGYRVVISGESTFIELEEQKLEELKTYILRFDNGSTVDIRAFGKSFDSYGALDAWLDGILVTSPMLGGGSTLYCTDDNAGTPAAIHVTGQNTVLDHDKICAVNITVPLAEFGTEFGWETRNTDLQSSQSMTAENGIEAELVITETSVTAYFAHNGILYRLSIAGNHEEATAVLTEIIGTMK